MPHYPAMAWSAGIAGDVILDVAFGGGRVVRASVRSGDRLLSDEAVRNVESWRFSVAATGTFKTIFTYQLTRMNGDDRSTRIELQLPNRVRVIAPENGR